MAEIPAVTSPVLDPHTGEPRILVPARECGHEHLSHYVTCIRCEFRTGGARLFARSSSRLVRPL
jgi:hypothetical protein